MLSDLSKCFSGSHLMSGHEVGKDTGGASRHSHLTIDKHLPASSESFIDELIDGIKMQRNVGLRNVKQPKTFVGDAPGLIEVLVCVDGALSLALGSVQDVSNS